MREGFWYNKKNSMLPIPRATSRIWKGKENFLIKLSEIELKKVQRNSNKGNHKCIICGLKCGNDTYFYKDWFWSESYIHYINDHNVRPSLAFQEMILNKTL